MRRGQRQDVLGLRSFNPRTHTGCDYLVAAVPNCAIIVSIHAPIQGATTPDNDQGDTDEFQSTHPYRVRLWFNGCKYRCCKFQSTHPYRVRLLCCERCSRCLPVSIHAPIQGATAVCPPSSHAYWFQSTHPYRVRLATIFFGKMICCFNPRTHTGCDHANINLQWLKVVSIHAPIQGATLMTSQKYGHCLFQSTHPYRVRRIGVFLQRQSKRFQSTHPYRVRLPTNSPSGQSCKFQSTHPYRVRL